MEITNGWGLMKPERRAEPVAMTPTYDGMGDDVSDRLREAREMIDAHVAANPNLWAADDA